MSKYHLVITNDTGIESRVPLDSKLAKESVKWMDADSKYSRVNFLPGDNPTWITTFGYHFELVKVEESKS